MSMNFSHQPDPETLQDLLGEDLPPQRETQAQRIVRKFGGVQPMVRALDAVDCARHETSIYRWTYDDERGTGGLIPMCALDDVLKAARHQGIILSAEDLDPRISPFNLKG